MLFLKIVFHCREGLFQTPIRFLFLERHSILFLISLFHWCWYRLKLCVSLVYNCCLKPGVYFSPSCLQKGKISQRKDSRSVNGKSKNGKIWTSYNKSHNYPSRRSSCVLLSFSLIKLINSRLHCCLSWGKPCLVHVHLQVLKIIAASLPRKISKLNGCWFNQVWSA